MAKLNRFEAELARMEGRIAEIESEIGRLRELLDYLDGLAGIAPAAPIEPRDRRKHKPKLKIDEALLKAMAGGKKLSTPDLVKALRRMGVESRTESIYSAISILRKKGVITAHDHSGRGHAYTIA